MSRNPKHAKSRAGIKIYARKHRRFRSIRGLVITIVILATIITGLVAVVIFNPNEKLTNTTQILRGGIEYFYIEIVS